MLYRSVWHISTGNAFLCHSSVPYFSCSCRINFYKQKCMSAFNAIMKKNALWPWNRQSRVKMDEYGKTHTHTHTAVLVTCSITLCVWRPADQWCVCVCAIWCILNGTFFNSALLSAIKIVRTMEPNPMSSEPQCVPLHYMCAISLELHHWFYYAIDSPSSASFN